VTPGAFFVWAVAIIGAFVALNLAVVGLLAVYGRLALPFLRWLTRKGAAR
jgi:hypothetical protein